MSSTPETPSPPRFCRRCNYNLSSLTTPRCPECAHPFNPANPRTFLRRPARRWLRPLRRIAACLLTLTLLLAALYGWLYWDWHDEQQALTYLRPNYAHTESLSPWLNAHLGSARFVLDRVDKIVLWRQEVRDISPVRRFTCLRKLDLHDTACSDLSPLASLNTLEDLNLEHTPASDLSPLARLSHLQSLNLDNTK